jgi:hypothetical protein
MAEDFVNNASSQWSMDVEGDKVCPDVWGLGVGNPNQFICSPIPYKVVSSDTDYFLTSIDFNYIIELRGTREGYITYPYNAPTLDLQETTIVSSQRFFTYAEAGVTINNYPGPQLFYTGPLSDGVMMKKIGDNKWLGLGDLIPIEVDDGIGNNG